MEIDFTKDQLKFIYADLLNMSPLGMPEDKMKILMKIRKILKWDATHLED